MGWCLFIKCSSLPQISMASCTTSPTPTGIKLKWWLASPWSSTRSCRSMELTRWGAETNPGCGILSLEPQMVSYLHSCVGIKTEWGHDCCLHTPWSTPRPVLPCKGKKKQLLRLTVLTGSEFVWGSGLTVSRRSCMWMTWLLSSLVSVALWEVEDSSSVTSPYCEKSLA